MASKKLARRTRAGNTDKISVSLDRADVLVLRERADRIYGGNLSAAVAEGVRRLREEQGREALVQWLGDAAHATAEEREALIAEWESPNPAVSSSRPAVSPSRPKRARRS